MTIGNIALIVFALAVALYFIRLAMDGRKERRRIEAFQQDIARQERIVNPDDDTATWPILPREEGKNG